MLTLIIARRYLVSRKSHAAVNIISYVSIAGIALAVAAMVVVLSVFNGFRAFTGNQITALEADCTVIPSTGKTIMNADSLCQLLGDIDGVSEASPVITERAFAIARDRQMPVMVYGIDGLSDDFIRFSRYTIDGTPYVGESFDRQWGMISVGVANSLLTIPESPAPVRLYEPRRVGRISPANPAASFRSDSIYVSAVIRCDIEQFDTDMVIVPIDMSRKLLGYDTQASYISIKLSDPKAFARIKECIGPDVRILTPLQRHNEAFKMINIEKWVTLLMLTFILIIAAFNILSTMAMLLADKRANMTAMQAMGASASLTGHIYMTLTMLVTMAGCVIGLITGIMLTLSQQMWGWFKMQVDDMSQLTITAYPVRLEIIDIVTVLAIAMVVGLIASMIVGRTARRMARRPH